MTRDATDADRMALQGLRVLDLTSYVPGPYASMLLGDLGADVVQVESPGGDPARRLPHRIGADSALHHWLGRNKSSRVLDLKSEPGHTDFFDLLASCDVVLESFTPGVATRLGVDYESCRAVNPALIYCSISGYGQSSPDAAAPTHDITLAARAGVLDQARDESGAPVPLGALVGDISAALHAAVGVLAALHHRYRTGEGQFIDVSILDSALAMVGPQLMKQFSGAAPRPGRDLNLGGDPGYQVYRTRDGHFVALGALEDKFWSRLCGSLGRPDLLQQRASNPGWVREELAEVFGSADRRTWDERLGGADVCYSPVNRLDEVADDPVVVGAGSVLGCGENPASALWPQLANPIRMSRTPPSLRHPSAPLGTARPEQTGARAPAPVARATS